MNLGNSPVSPRSQEFGITAAAEELAAAGPQPKERKPRSAKPQASDGGSDLAGPSRRSHRVADPDKKVSYKDDEYWKDAFKGVPGLHGGGGGGGGGREARIVDEAEVAALRERNGADGVVTDTAGLTASAIKRGPVDSGKGVRIQVRVRGGAPCMSTLAIHGPKGLPLLMPSHAMPFHAPTHGHAS